MTPQASGSAESPSDQASARIGQVVASRYRLEALLGLGATGAVYRAAHPGGHPVAIKILDPSLMESDAATRFIRESELMLGIHHPNVVQTLAAGRDERLGLLYLVMPLLHGEDLDAILQRIGALDPTTAVRIALQAARGIAAAHRLGIVHRDIKPGNLFVDSRPDGKVSLRVCDFGIAKSATGGNDVSLTRTGSQLGTPDYISPEQLKDSKSVDQRADIWGLGATLYEMLSGRPPFSHHERVFDVISAILSEEIEWLQDRAPWIDAELAHVVHRTLRRSPAERPQSMDALIEVLLPFSGGDGALTNAQLVPLSPILKKVQKPRGTPPEPQGKRPVPARGARPAAAPPEPAHSATLPKAAPVTATEATSRPERAVSTGKNAKPVERPARPRQKPRKSRAGVLFFVLILVALTAVGVFWNDLSPVVVPWLEGLSRRP